MSQRRKVLSQKYLKVGKSKGKSKSRGDLICIGSPKARDEPRTVNAANPLLFARLGESNNLKKKTNKGPTQSQILISKKLWGKTGLRPEIVKITKPRVKLYEMRGGK